MERGIKESGYETLGRRSENNHSMLAMAGAINIPDAMVAGTKLGDKGHKKDRYKKN